MSRIKWEGMSLTNIQWCYTHNLPTTSFQIPKILLRSLLLLHSLMNKDQPNTFLLVCGTQNCDLRHLTIDNFLQKRACCFVFDCLNGTKCFPFKDYIQRLHHNALSYTRNNGKTAKLPKVRLDFARRSF